MSKNSFTVIDVKTGEYPDLKAIALYEDWAKGLAYYDIEGFAIMEDGSLILMDGCDDLRYCPVGRFEIVWGDDTLKVNAIRKAIKKLKEQESVVHPEPSCEMTYITDCCCDLCGVQLIREDNFCRGCGKPIEWSK